MRYNEEEERSRKRIREGGKETALHSLVAREERLVLHRSIMDMSGRL